MFDKEEFNKEEFNKKDDIVNAHVGLFTEVLRYTMMKDKQIKEQQQPINVKKRAEDLYNEYIFLAKRFIEDNKLSVSDFFSSLPDSMNREYQKLIITKLGVLQEVLYYNNEKIKHDIERAE